MTNFNLAPIIICARNSSAIAEILTEQVHPIVQVSDANNVLEIIETQHPVLIITDSVHGCEVMNELAPTPILAIGSHDNIDAFIDAGASDCVPLHHRLLPSRVDCLIQSYTLAAYDHLPTMVHAINADKDLIYVNLHWLETMGYSRGEVIGRSILDFMSETSRRVAPRLMETFWKTGFVRNLAFRYVRKNGEPLDVLIDSTLQDESYALTVLSDITALKQAETEIKVSQHELQSVVNALTDSVAVMNREGEYLRIVRASNRTYDLDLDALIGKSLRDVVDQDLADLLIDLIQETLQTQQIQRHDYSIVNKQGNTRWQSITMSALTADEVVFVIRDITQHKLAETQLIESEQRYRSLFQNATDAIFVVDVMTGLIAEASPQATRMLGYSTDELIGMSMDEIEASQITITENPTLLDDTEDNYLIVETTYRHKDGYPVHVETSSRFVQEGNKLFVISFVRDITERKKAIEEIERQRNLAQALLDTANILNEMADLETVLDSILSNVRRIMPVEHANIMLIEDGIAKVVRHLGYAEFESKDILNISLPLKDADNLFWVFEHQRALRIDDTHNSPFRWADSTTASFVKSILTAPIRVSNKVIGFINLDSTKVGTFTDEHGEQLLAFANQVAIAIQQAHSLEALNEYADRLEKRVEEAQAQLSDERNLLRHIIDTLPDAIYVKDREGKFILANRATVEYIEGVETFTDLIGKTDAEIYPEIAERLQQEEQRIMLSGQAQLNQIEVYQDKTGSMTHLLVTKLPLVDASGQITGLIGMNHNISELRQAEAQLELVLRSARCLLWSATVTEVIDKDGDSDYVWDYKIANEQAAQDFLPLDTTEQGYTEAWLAAIPSEEQAKRSYVFQTHVKFENYNYSQEFAIILDDGHKHWLNEDVLIQKLEDGRWSLVGVCTDITAQKNIQQRLQTINEELEQRVERRTLQLTETNSVLRSQILERERAQEAERNQRIIAETLRDSVAKLSSSLDRDAVFDHLLSAMRPIIPHDAANIMFIDNGEVEIVRASGYEKPIVGLRYKLQGLDDLQTVMQTKSPYIIADIHAYESWSDFDRFDWVRSNMTVPIIVDDNVIGFLNLDSSKANSFNEEHARLMMTFGDQAGIAIRNARYTEQLENRVQERTAELEERTFELDVERAKFKAILDAMNDGVIYIDTNRQPLYINRGLVELTGYSEEEWFDGTAKTGITNASSQEAHEGWHKILQTLDEHNFWKGETELIRKDGTLFDAALVLTEVRNHANERVGIVAVVRDISQEKRLQQQKARFIANAAHELRTPIANIKTRLFLMKRTPERFMEHIEIAESVANLMRNLVDHMFDLSRFERGVIELNHEPVEIQRLFNEIIQYQKPQAERLNIAFKLDMPDEPLIIQSDPFRLTQVMTNLIGNALNYTRPNSDIVLYVVAKEENVWIEVQDSGEGIAEEHLPNLFQPFYRVAEDNKGTGLGLAIVQEIIHAHDGNITVESEIGVGTTFKIRLPISQPEFDSIQS